MRRARSVGLALAFALAATACALAVDTSGLTGGSSGASPADAGGDAPAPGRDAAGPAPDAGGGDASADADAAVTRFCAPGHGHALCADFDEGAYLAGFDNQVIGPVGEVVAASERSRSAPKSLRTTLGRRESTIEYAVVIHSRTAPWRRVVTEFDVFLQQPDFKAADINAGIFTAGFYGELDANVAFSVGPDYTTLAVPSSAISGPAFPFDRWVHVRFDMDPLTGKVSSTVDGARLERSFAPTAQGNSPTTALSFGVSGYNKPCPTFRVFYDNVVVDYP